MYFFNHKLINWFYSLEQENIFGHILLYISKQSRNRKAEPRTQPIASNTNLRQEDYTIDCQGKGGNESFQSKGTKNFD